MKDPFFIPPSPILSKAVQPLADFFSLPTLPLHIHEIVIMASFYQFVATVISPLVSLLIFPTQYEALSRSKKLSWDVHVVSLVQSTTINILALWVLFTDQEVKEMDWQERLWGYDGAAAMIQAFAAGYFVWDLIITASNVKIFGLGMLAHAISALLAYSLGFRPFVNYYSCNFILWELSSPFLNIHWFCDKVGLTGSKFQLYNGFLLIGTFFSCRLVYGTLNSYWVARDILAGINATPNVMATLAAKDAANVTLPVTLPASYEQTMIYVNENTTVPLWLAAVYIGANLTLNCLNFYWFFKMIEAIRKRFDTPDDKAADKKTVETEEKPKGAVEGATTALDGPATELKMRPRRGTLLDGEEADLPPPN
ncbi:TLC domain-containing protein [Microdochium trichocladiopsis]|uniref:TLC domain-containing protein n=1 Tax=Microdochium trichocladiopsis TaxID=1682393 RepID=A0A9P8Y601_9PEZI|nr:TLC domain-containing protein [Microdochium trichocladiopsis]KAH7030805.1 TLC domain-containing protein [Microdochium trichocladiopsis]